jgi:hypothetical protein
MAATRNTWEVWVALLGGGTGAGDGRHRLVVETHNAEGVNRHSHVCSSRLSQHESTLAEVVPGMQHVVALVPTVLEVTGGGGRVGRPQQRGWAHGKGRCARIDTVPLLYTCRRVAPLSQQGHAITMPGGGGHGCVVWCQRCDPVPEVPAHHGARLDDVEHLAWLPLANDVGTLGEVYHGGHTVMQHIRNAAQQQRKELRVEANRLEANMHARQKVCAWEGNKKKACWHSLWHPRPLHYSTPARTRWYDPHRTPIITANTRRGRIRLRHSRTRSKWTQAVPHADPLTPTLPLPSPLHTNTPSAIVKLMKRQQQTRKCA